MALSPAAAKVATNPDPRLVLADDNTHISLTVDLRNLSGHPLTATKTGTVLEWWDDEHPVTERDIFSNTRVPNGAVTLELPNDTKLKEGFETLTYSGDLSEASLIPRSFTPYDIMGGPEVEKPTPAEYDQTRKSFEEILKRYRKGSIDVRFEVVTEGDITSTRTVTIPLNDEGF